MSDHLDKDNPPSDPHDDLESFYGGGTDNFTLKFHYNGVFKEEGGNKVYYGGSVKLYDDIDPDTVCVGKFINSGVKLTKRKDIACYFRVPTLNLNSGLRELRSDKDIRDLTQWVPTFRVIDIYVVTSVCVEKIPPYIVPSEDEASEDNTSESQDSCDESDDLRQVEPPSVLENDIEKIETKSHKFIAAWNGGDLFEVSTAYSCYVVNLKERTCTCRRFQLSGIPCYHTAAAILYMKEKLEDYVNECYFRSTYLKTYENILVPLNGKELWEKSTKPPLSPPIVKVQPGRKKMKRNKKNDEPKSLTKLGKHGTEMHCTKCGKVGHNVRRCGITMGGETSSAAGTRKRPSTEIVMDSGPVLRRGRGRPRRSGVPRPRPPAMPRRPVRNAQGKFVMPSAGTQESHD